MIETQRKSPTQNCLDTTKINAHKLLQLKRLFIYYRLHKKYVCMYILNILKNFSVTIRDRLLKIGQQILHTITVGNLEFTRALPPLTRHVPD